jgi:hypothetical protein
MDIRLIKPYSWSLTEAKKWWVKKGMKNSPEELIDYYLRAISFDK